MNYKFLSGLLKETAGNFQEIKPGTAELLRRAAVTIDRANYLFDLIKELDNTTDPAAQILLKTAIDSGIKAWKEGIPSHDQQ